MNVPARPTTIQLELRIDGAAPTGLASVDGRDSRAFSGWIGLVRAVEELLDEDRVESTP
ncbi:MAG TPA: hypothetical protein VI300_11430 [Solirubrobacter sp.]